MCSDAFAAAPVSTAVPGTAPIVSTAAPASGARHHCRPGRHRPDHHPRWRAVVVTALAALAVAVSVVSTPLACGPRALHWAAQAVEFLHRHPGRQLKMAEEMRRGLGALREPLLRITQRGLGISGAAFGVAAPG
ncbi:hypothetical protein [Streptomyces bangladeshensis]|uniref:Uncharacterized protein n=1 Tax=Streptomyces bangladeshensis TaxID=295352 RepID=A0ABN3BCU4_9ACTN